jgi:Starch-binding associating with outer membrane
MPLYASRVGSFDEIRVSKTLSDRLTALNDTRLNVFGRPSQSSVTAGTPKIEGIPNGLGDVAALNYNGGPQGVSRVGYTFACLVCNDPGQAVPDPAAPRAIIMNYAELQFILAEAREKGMITAGTADTYYTNGIAANFDYWKTLVPTQYSINVNMPAGYLTQPLVAYAGTQADKLGKIALQKWIALYFNGLEAWFDWRRTGMPDIIPGASNLNGGKVPVRYIYPLSEQSLNGANRLKAVTAQGGTDDINTKMWLLR